MRDREAKLQKGEVQTEWKEKLLHCEDSPAAEQVSWGLHIFRTHLDKTMGNLV